MRAVVCNSFGPLSSLVIEERPPTPLAEGDLRLEVTAAGVNFVDALIVQGLYQVKPAVPFVPGGECVGVVTELGAGVSAPAVGDRVLVSPGLGAFASELVTAAARVLVPPSVLSDGQAATFLQSYLTAYFALTRRASLWPGATVLVLGAGGGVGLAAVDVGRALGFDMIAVASTPEKRALATAHGARVTIDSSAGDAAAVKSAAREFSEGGVDAVYDPVGGELGTECLRALKENGQHLVIGFAAGAIPQLPANQILLSNRRVTGVDLGGWLSKHPDDQPDMLTDLFGLIEAGQLAPVEPAAYPLDQAADALAAQHSRTVAGKTVLIP